MNDFIIENYNYGEKKVAFFLKRNRGDILINNKNLQKIAEFNHINLFVFDTLNEKLFGNHTYYMNPKQFKKYYLKNKQEYNEKYQIIIDFVGKNKINLCLFLGNLITFSGGDESDNFYLKLRKITKIASYVADDDVISVAERISKPYVKYFDYSFCAAIYYKGDKILLKDKYKERGGKITDYIPLGLSYGKYKELGNIDYDNRNIDILYVGGCYGLKIIRIFKLKKHFGNRMEIYGRGWMESNSLIKTMILRFLRRYYNVGEIKPLDKDDFIEKYQDTKIGFNLHQDYGPTNMRMYELPGNGCLQICDNPKGLSMLFKLDEEVIGYTHTKEAIKKIEYYLDYDNERKKIAEAGYKKAINNYRIEQCFSKLFNTVFK